MVTLMCISGEQKILDPTGNQTPTPSVVLAVVSRYSDCAILVGIRVSGEAIETENMIMCCVVMTNAQF
jgi:hypothetical protein